MTALAEAVYVFGIVPADAIDAGDHDEYEVVYDGAIAAVVGCVPAEHALGADDLRRHDRVIASLVERGVPVLPMRFGAAVADRDTVVTDVLAPNADNYAAALGELAGLVQFTIQVRYERMGILREIVAADPDVARARVLAAEPAASTAAKMRLGELVVAAIARRRAMDAERIRSAVVPLAREVRLTLADDPDSVGQLACLVSSSDRARFEDGLERLARDCHATMRLRLLGPLAPYDFVPAH